MEKNGKDTDQELSDTMRIVQFINADIDPEEIANYKAKQRQGSSNANKQEQEPEGYYWDI